MIGNFKKKLLTELDLIKKDGLYKEERVIVNPQGRCIKVSSGDNVLNFYANNYLGLSSHPDVVKAAKRYGRYPWIWYVFSSFYLWNSRYSQGIRKKNFRIFIHRRYYFVCLRLF